MTCPRCGSISVVIGPGKGPHYAQEKCGECGRWLRWLKKPRGATTPPVAGALKTPDLVEPGAVPFDPSKVRCPQ